MSYKDYVIDKCIHCSKCTKNCEFLEKYKIDLAGQATRDDLAYNCFLCGKCKFVCPLDLDGREVSMEQRLENPKDFRYINLTKKNYIFSNRKHGNTKEILFFGCNFPGFYPETTQKLISIFKEHSIGFSIDCCGKPLYESSNKEGTDILIDRLNNYFEENGIETLISICPNCHYFFKGKVNVKIVTVYDKLRELELGNAVEEHANLFTPCPDRSSLEILKTIRPFAKDIELSYRDVNCCGLGGLANGQEPEIANGYIEALKKKNKENIYTYCATCSGQFNKNKLKNIKHVLTEITGTKEKPNSNYAKNVIKAKFYK